LRSWITLPPPQSHLLQCQTSRNARLILHSPESAVRDKQLLPSIQPLFRTRRHQIISRYTATLTPEQDFPQMHMRTKRPAHKSGTHVRPRFKFGRPHQLTHTHKLPETTTDDSWCAQERYCPPLPRKTCWRVASLSFQRERRSKKKPTLDEYLHPICGQEMLF
jgi:hypothetical protein